MANRTCSSYLDYPDEVLLMILKLLDPHDVMNFRLASRKCHAIADDPILWKCFFCTGFKYASLSHETCAAMNYDPALSFQERFSKFNWQKIVFWRLKVNVRVSQLFETIVRTKQHRCRNIARICRYGMEAKDFLLQQCRVPDDHPEVLCRRWFANRVINAIHRSTAMDEWWQYSTNRKSCSFRLQKGYEKKQLERVIGGFDMFFMQQDEGDIDTISRMLDEYADDFRKHYPDCMEKSIHDRALLLLRWVHRTLCSISPLHLAENPNIFSTPISFHPVKTLLGCVLLYDLEDVCPHVTQTIFIALAQRLDIPAYLCTHGYYVIVPRTPVELSYFINRQAPHDDKAVPLALMPGRSNNPEPLPSTWEPQLEDELYSRYVWVLEQFSGVISGIPRPPNAFYSSQVPARTQRENQDIMSYLTACFETFMGLPVTSAWVDQVEYLLMNLDPFPEDIWLLMPYLKKMRAKYLETFAAVEDLEDIQETVDRFKRKDAKPRKPRVAPAGVDDTTRRFRIGDVVRSTPECPLRFLAVVAGWNWSYPSTGEKPTALALTYLCLTISYVPQGNFHCGYWQDKYLERVSDSGEVLRARRMHAAGRFFKRFDPDTCRFVSNIREKYPED